MPATEETYRSQARLHVVFAITSVAMLLSIVWMIMADHLRPWKQVQRRFQAVEEAKLKAVERDKLAEQRAKYRDQIEAIDAKIARARQGRQANTSATRRSATSAAGSSGSTPGSGSPRPSWTASGASTTA
jgi:biopolymer transport protein ExbB/TolQ